MKYRVRFYFVFSKENGTTLKAAGEFYDAYVAVVADAMKAGDKVALVGFGTYEAKKKPARVCKNPQTGKEVKVAACKAPSLKFGKSFKESIN